MGVARRSSRRGVSRSPAEGGGRGMTQAQSEPQSAVFVVDDDASVRESLKSLFRMVGHGVEAFPSTSDFLRSKLPDVASCLVLDIRLPGISGLDFQAELARANRRIPI